MDWLQWAIPGFVVALLALIFGAGLYMIMQRRLPWPHGIIWGERNIRTGARLVNPRLLGWSYLALCTAWGPFLLIQWSDVDLGDTASYVVAAAVFFGLLGLSIVLGRNAYRERN